MKRILFATTLASLAGCNQTNINTPIRVFDRPSDVAIACRQVVPQPNSDPNNFIFDAHPIEDCAPEALAARTPTDSAGNPIYTPTGDYFEGPVLAALVTQSARGEVALVDVSLERVVDLQRAVPGFNFVPVGKLPEHVRVSKDGCLAATANVDSCDVSVIDLPTLYNMQFLPYRSPAPAPDFADNVVRRLTPTVNGQPLGARPSWIELAPYTRPALRGYEPGGTPGQCVPNPSPSPSPTPYHAWVAFPGCSLLAELDVSATTENLDGPTNAEVIRALRFTQTGVEVVNDVSTISCPSECGPPNDGGTVPDVVDGGSDDGGSPDGGSRLPMTQAQPATAALDIDENGLGRLFVGDRVGERLTIVPFDKDTGALGTPRQLQLDPGALGVQVVRISPRTEAGKFLYAVARDATVRVIDLDREAECETNPDPRALQDIPPSDPYVGARQVGCFPLGDPATPRRSSLATSPGITLPGLALPKDVAFVHVDAPPPVAANIAGPAAGPATLVGDYAWIIGSDGRATVVNIFDACPAPNIPQLQSDGNYTPACSPDAVDASRALTYTSYFGHPLPMSLDRVAHRLRSGSSRFFQATNFSDNVGQPRLSDPNNAFQIAINGIPKTAGQEGVAADLPSLIPVLFVSPSPSVFPALPANDNSRYLSFIDPDRVRAETWNVEWEGVVPGTHRTLGAVYFRAPDTNQPLSAPLLVDNGGAWCSHGVLAGDKLQFTGCNVDEDCGYLDYCVRDQAAPSDVQVGMCLRRDMASQLQDVCKNLLRAPRRYRVLSARQAAVVDPTLDASGKSDTLALGELYEPEHPVETRLCTVKSDCDDIKVLNAAGDAALPTDCLTDSDGAKRCLLPCVDDQGCGHDFQCLTSRFGDKRCVLAPLDETLFKTCMPELQTYEIHAGDAFIVVGSLTGIFSDLQADPLTRECEIPPESSELARLQQARIPAQPPALCPSSLDVDPLAPLPADVIDPVSGVATNVCQLTGGALARFSDAGDGVHYVHYENPLFSFLLRVRAGPLPVSKSGSGMGDSDGGVVDLGSAADMAGAGLLPGTSTPTVPPDLLTLSFSVIGSGFPLSAPLAVDVQAQQPRYAAVAPDRQTVFVVDEGKQTVGVGLRGQLLKLSSQAVAVDHSFQVR